LFLTGWLSINAYGHNAFASKGNRLSEAARIYALEKEIEQLKEELITYTKGG
jgi:hypothetical protein